MVKRPIEDIGKFYILIPEILTCGMSKVKRLIKECAGTSGELSISKAGIASMSALISCRSCACTCV